MKSSTSSRRRRGPRRRLAGSTALLVALVTTVLAASACEPAAIEGQGYELVFEDQFDGETLDPVWEDAPFANEIPASISSGSMLITSQLANDDWGYVATTGPRASGEPSYPDALSWQEGYFEARLRFTDDPWAWPAFWLFSMSKTEAWPGEDCPPEGELTSEWDIMEGGLNNKEGDRPASTSVYSVLHRNTVAGTVPYCGIPDEKPPRFIRHAPSGVDFSDWHTWGGLWTEDELCLYLDDSEIGCLEPYDTTAQPMHLIFTINYAGLCGGCPAKPAELEMEIDWVRVWQQP